MKANLSVDGANYSLSLNDELVGEFIEFYKGKEGTLIYSKPSEAINGFYELPFSASSTSEDPIVLASINFINSNPYLRSKAKPTNPFVAKRAIPNFNPNL